MGQRVSAPPGGRRRPRRRARHERAGESAGERYAHTRGTRSESELTIATASLARGNTRRATTATSNDDDDVDRDRVDDAAALGDDDMSASASASARSRTRTQSSRLTLTRGSERTDDDADVLTDGDDDDDDDDATPGARMPRDGTVGAASAAATASADAAAHAGAQDGDGKAPRRPLRFLALAVSQAGSWVAAGASDALVRAWDVASEERREHALHGHRGAVTCVAFTRAGDALVSADEAGGLRAWHVGTWACVWEVPDAHASAIHSLVWLPLAPRWDGDVDSDEDDGAGALAGAQQLTPSAAARATAAASSAASGARASPALTSGVSVRDLVVSDAVPSSLSPSAALGADAAAGGRRRRRVARDRFATAADGDSVVCVWHAQSLRRVVGAAGSLQHATVTGAKDAGVVAVAASANGRLLAASFGRGNVCLWDVLAGAQLACWRAHSDAATGVAFSPANDAVLATVSADARACAWAALQDGSVQCLFKVSAGERGSRGDNDVPRCRFGHGRTLGTLAVTSGDQFARLFAPSSSDADAAVPAGMDAIELGGCYGKRKQVLFSLHGRFAVYPCLLRAPSRFGVRVWDVVGKRQAAVFTTGEVHHMTLGHDGRRLVVASSRGLSLWLMPADDGDAGDDDNDVGDSVSDRGGGGAESTHALGARASQHGVSLPAPAHATPHAKK